MNNLNDILISTKLHAPPVRPRMLSRRHLLGRLSTGKDSRLIVITGAAASGKTSLASQWIRRDKLWATWYSLDKTDNESDMFFRYLLTAFGNMDSKLESRMRPWLQSNKRLLGKEIIPFLVGSFIDTSKDLYLVLDDYHSITSREVHSSLSYLLDNMPPRLHVVIVSRYSIPFSLAHFKVRNQMVEISGEEMKFTDKEMEQYFREIMPLKFSAEEIKEISWYSEGWVGALQLFGLSLAGGNTARDLNSVLSRTRDATTEYLINEVIAVQPKNIKAFLYATAPLDRFNAALSQEITGLAHSEAILDYAYRNNIFLVPLDTERTWYRYHHLFAEVIRKTVKTTGPDKLSHIHQTAAKWFAKNGHLEDAFRHAFSSEDMEFAADMLEDYMQDLFQRYEETFALRWLSNLPPAVMKKRLLLKLYECLLKIDSMQLTNIEETMKPIENQLKGHDFCHYNDRKKRLCDDLFTYLKTILMYYHDPENEALMDQLDKAHQMISWDNEILPPLLIRIKANSYALRGQFNKACETMQDASRAITSSENVWDRTHFYRSMSFLEGWRGDLYRAEVAVKEGFEFLDQKGLSDHPIKFKLYVPLASVLYLRNDIEKALEYGTVGLEYVNRVEHTPDILEGCILLSYVYLALYQKEEAKEALQELWKKETTYLPNEKLLKATTSAILAHIAFLQNDFQTAEQWADQRRLSMDEPFSFRFAIDCLSQLAVLYQQGQYREAGDMAKTLRGRCLDGSLIRLLYDIDCLYSASLYKLNEKDQARKIMGWILRTAEDSGTVRPFVNYAPIISPILTDLTGNHHVEGELSSHTVVIMKACGIDINGVAGYQDHLTRREIEILKLMAAGYTSYGEMAKKTFVSLGTIRTHVTHIYRKLNVNTRNDAVQRGKELNLF